MDAREWMQITVGTPKGGTKRTKCEPLLSDSIVTVQMQFFKMGATERCIKENKNDYTFS